MYAKHGTVRANIVNQIQPQPDGSVNLPGTLQDHRRHRALQGRHRQRLVRGPAPAGSTVSEADMSGKIRY